jgi:NAD(P)-dependent dehydrogenase (short-subunit alcohol dehydrogenase family)
VLAGVRNEAAAQALSEASFTNGGSAGAGGVQPITLDVTDPAHIAGAAAAVQDAGGRLDALVNNAGIGVGGPLELVESEELRRQFEVNVFGQIDVTRALVPALRRAGGRIVFISSIGGLVTTPYLAPYAASKHAIEAFGDALRVELRTSNVRTILIEPGSVATPIWEKGQAEAESISIPPELSQQYGHVPAAVGKALADTAKRGVPPDRVAATIERALASSRPRARYLVGTDAKILLLINRLLPDLVYDRLIRRMLGV